MTFLGTLIVLTLFYGSGAIYCYTDGYCADEDHEELQVSSDEES